MSNPFKPLPPPNPTHIKPAPAPVPWTVAEVIPGATSGPGPMKRPTSRVIVSEAKSGKAGGGGGKKYKM